MGSTTDSTDLTELTISVTDLEAQPPLTCVDRSKYTKKHHQLTKEELRTGFGLHSLSSLEIAIKKARPPRHVCKCDPCAPDEVTDEILTSSTELEDVSHPSFGVLQAEKELKYLMGLDEEIEEEASAASSSVTQEEPRKATEEDRITDTCDSMRKAQRYLREHRIFEFFQFLIAHLLAETPIDVIDFLIDLIDKCLIYRSGIGEPPMLYQKKHIECLFNLMDRMRTGFVDFNQYHTGMMTLGLKSYERNPPKSADGMVSKVFFVEESYNCLRDLLNDMIRKRFREVRKRKRAPKAPPPSAVRSACPLQSTDNIFL